MATTVFMPKLGLTMEAGMIVRWLVTQGDSVKQGQPLMEVETDKVVVEVEADAVGVMGPLLVEAGVEVAVGTILSAILDPGESDDKVEALLQDSVTTGTAITESSQAELKSVPDTALAEDLRYTRITGRIFSSPRARTQANTLGVDWKTLSGSGPRGRVVERDVLQAARRRTTVGPMSSAEGGAAGHFYLSAELNLTALFQILHAISTAGMPSDRAQISLLDWLLKIATVIYLDLLSSDPEIAGKADLSLAFGQLQAGGETTISVIPGKIERQSINDYASQRRQLLNNRESHAASRLKNVLLVLDLSQGRVQATPFDPAPAHSLLLVLGPSIGAQETNGQDAIATLSLVCDTYLMTWQSGMQFMDRVIELVEEPLLLLGA